MRDMTKGSPVRHLLGFAAPMLLGNIFQQLYSTADAMVLGRGVGAQALAAAGATGSVQFFVFGFINGLTQGASVLIAQRFGAGDPKRLRETAANALYLSAAASLVIMLVSLLGSRPLLQLLETPADIFDGALEYIRILFIGIATMVFYNILAAILRALGDSISPLLVVVVSSVLNVGLDFLFVVTFHWGIAGAAWATVLAQGLSGVMCLALLLRIPVMRFVRDELRPRADILRELLRMGLPVGVMSSVTAVGTMILQGVVNGFGSEMVAAHTAGSRLTSFAGQPGSIIGMSLGTYVGQNMGANRLDRVKLGVRRAIAVSLSVNLVICAVLICFGRALAAVFFADASAPILDAAHSYLIITGSMEWALSLLFIYRFSLHSMGDTLVPLLSGALELVMRVAAVLFCTRVLRMGFLSIAIAEGAAWFGAGLLLGVMYYVRMGRLERKNLTKV